MKRKVTAMIRGSFMKWLKVLSFLLINIFIFLLYCGCTPQPATTPPTDPLDPATLTVDWNMNAYLVQPDGTPADTFKFFSLPLKGSIHKEEAATYLRINIEFPKYFRYSKGGISQPKGEICTNYGASWPGDFPTASYTYDSVKNAPALAAWAINTEKEYFIAYWGEEFGHYVVACTDPDVKPAEIMEHFEEFIEHNLVALNQQK